jgi:uncharacterized membrane protein YfcA
LEALSLDIRFTLAGAVVGLLVGLTGIGGSSLLAPVLILLLGVKPLVAVGTDLVYSVPTKIVATLLHMREQTVDWTIARALLLGGLPGIGLGFALIELLRAKVDVATLNLWIKHGIGTAILFACVTAIAVPLINRASGRGQRARDEADPVPRKRGVLLLVGLLVGFLVCVTSIGSGSVTLPLLMLALPGVALRRLIGSEIAFAAFLIPLAALGHASMGNVDWRASASLLAGALPGVYAGSRLCAVLSDAALRPIVIVVLAIAGYKLI